MKYRDMLARYMGRLPNTSERGAKNSGLKRYFSQSFGGEYGEAYPIPKPITKQVTVKFVISCLMPSSFVGPFMSPVTIELPMATERHSVAVLTVIHLSSSTSAIS